MRSLMLITTIMLITTANNYFFSISMNEILYYYYIMFIGTWSWWWVWLEAGTWRHFPSSYLPNAILFSHWFRISNHNCCILCYHVCYSWRIIYWVSRVLTEGFSFVTSGSMTVILHYSFYCAIYEIRWNVAVSLAAFRGIKVTFVLTMKTQLFWTLWQKSPCFHVINKCHCYRYISYFRRGSMLSTSIFMYAATAPVNGYFGGSLYSRMGGE